ncbi:hypothetical protein ACIP88_37455 [Streptomyces uncialis]|uniref:hypothetical protein n=1 Tax=Streptomyces uncialis TaxID=1048205 RepID=UPI00381F2468
MTEPTEATEATEPTEAIEAIECRATRRGRIWVAHLPEHGVFGHGRTLKTVCENILQGLALVGVTAEVHITADTPELEKLRSAKAAYEAALTEAVDALALRRAPLRDIAQATETTVTGVRGVLAAQRALPPHYLFGGPAMGLPASGPGMTAPPC